MNIALAALLFVSMVVPLPVAPDAPPLIERVAACPYGFIMIEGWDTVPDADGVELVRFFAESNQPEIWVTFSPSGDILKAVVVEFGKAHELSESELTARFPSPCNILAKDS